MKLKYLPLLLIIVLPFLTLNSYFNTVIIDKLTLENGSAFSRYKDMMLDLRIFIENPMIGIGMGNLETLERYKLNYSYGTGSNGILYLLRNLGSMAIPFFLPLVFPSYLKKVSPLGKLVIPISFFLIFFTQNFTIILIFSLILFYGINTKFEYKFT